MLKLLEMTRTFFNEAFRVLLSLLVVCDIYASIIPQK